MNEINNNIQQAQPTQAAVSLKRPNCKKRASLFSRALIIYAASLAVLGACLLGVCWSVLKQYEDSQPKYVVEDACDDFTPYLEGALREVYIDSIGEYESWDDVFSRVLAPAFAGDYTYKRNAREYTAENPVFTVSAESDIANITLEKTPERSSFGFAVWRVKDVEVIADLSGVSTISTDISVPVGSVVKINGKVLCGTPERTVAYPFATKYEQGQSLPEYSVYTVSGLYAEPVIEAEYNSRSLSTREGEGAVFELPSDMLRTLSVTVPYTARVKVGGVLLGESDVTDERISFVDALKYDDAHYVRYEIRGLVTKPQVEAFDSQGKKLDGMSEVSEGAFSLAYKESDAYRLRVLFPTGAVTLTVGGVDAAGEVRSDNIPAYFYTDGLEKYIQGHVSLGYVELDRIYGTPEVKCTDSSGRELKAHLTESEGEVYYTFSPVPDDSLKSEYESYAIAYTDDYIGYCSGGYQIVNTTFAKAAKHLAPNSPAYTKLESTKFSFGQNKAYTVSNKQITTYDYIKLGENAFSCLVDFEMDVTTTYNVEQKTQHEKVEGMRLTFAKVSGAWKIVGLGM